MKSVLVLDADQRSALAVTRSLGRRGIPVYTGESKPVALAGCSRFSRQFSEYPSPAREPEHFIQSLHILIEKQRIGILLPMTELTSRLLLEHRQAFSGIQIPFPELQTVNRLADKCSLIRLASRLQIPVPETWYADSPEKLPVPLEQLPYPLIIKPGKSWLFLQGQWRRAGVRRAKTPREAQEVLDQDPAFQAHPFLLQRHIEGHGAGIFALYDNGKPLVFFAHRRLREKPPEGGVSVLSESIEAPPQQRSLARTLLDHARWHGIAMVEFRVTQDGTPYLMEINTRFWGSLQLAIDAGVDFPWLLYQLASGREPETVSCYQAGVRLRWLLGDLDHLYLVLRDNRYQISRKIQAVLDFFHPSPLRTRHEVNRWNDMAPFWHELNMYIRDLL